MTSKIETRWFLIQTDFELAKLHWHNFFGKVRLENLHKGQTTFANRNAALAALVPQQLRVGTIGGAPTGQTSETVGSPCGELHNLVATLVEN